MQHDPLSTSSDLDHAARLARRSKRAYRRSLTIQTRFLLGTALILLVFCVVSAMLIYFHEKHLLEESAHAKTQLVMTAVEANRAYVRNILRPKMYDTFGQDFFMMEAMSTSFVSRAVMDLFQDSLPEFDYRRVSINARNPASEANAIEREMIDYFKHNEGVENWQGMLQTDHDAYYRRFMPVYFEQSCMNCHGLPQDAPRDLVEIYGKERGFGHYAGELAGVIAVGIPVDSALGLIKEKATSVFLVVFMGVSIFYIALSFFFNRVVVHNLHGLMDIFRRELDEPDQPVIVPQDVSKDEIEELTTSAIILAGRLHRTQEELRNHAQNLEKQVAQRTKALEESKKLLQDKVVARNQELRTLNTIAGLTTQATGLAQMLPSALRETLELIPAIGAGIFLIDRNSSRLVLRHQENADCLPASIHLPDSTAHEPSSCHDAAEGESRADANLLRTITAAAAEGRLVRYVSQTGRGLMHIPLDCRGNVLGVLTLTGLDMDNLSAEQEDLLISIGRQIGIALESLNNLHQLLQSKELLQSVFDGITDLVVLLDRDLRIKMVNKAYLRRYGPDPEAVLHRHCHQLHHRSPASCPDCGLSEVIASKKAVSKETKCSSGEIFLVNYYPLFDEQGEVGGVIRYARDITDQKRVEQKIQQTEKLVAMGQLAAGVAHEINNPLGVILCYVNLLKRQLSEYPQSHQDLAVIEKQAQSCKRIVSDLLQFARGQESTKSKVSLNNAISEVVQMLAHQFKNKKLSVELDLAEDLPDCMVDVNKMKQVFVNLLMNAIHALNGNGAIRISSRFMPDQGIVELTFEDSGTGIPAEIRDKIFDPFFSTKTTGDGTGLGLSVSYGIVQEHGGDITVKSEPGAGATFIIRLPAE